MTDARRSTLVVGGVAHLYQGDLDVGRVAIERLRLDDLGPEVELEEFSYGAVAVAQRLEELAPDTLVLIGARERGRPPGTVARDAVRLPPSVDAARAQGAIADAVTGYIALDLVLEVAHALGALPRRTIVIDVEPATTVPSPTLSAEAEAALPEVLELVRREIRHTTSSRPRL